MWMNPQLFGSKAAKIRRKELGFNYPDDLGTVPLEDHPKLLRELLADSLLKSYSVRPQVLESIKDL